MRKRTDDNHAAVMAVFQAMGCTVMDTSQIGRGFGDCVIGVAGIDQIVEIKNGTQKPSDRRLTDAEDKFHSTWRGRKPAVVLNVDDAARLVMKITQEKYGR